MLDLVTNAFPTMGFLPHGQCFLWLRELLLLHVVSDSLTALAYYSIPIALVYFVHKRTDLEFGWMFLMFAAFILACGTTHILGVWTVWNPDYWLFGSEKAITAAVSLSTAVLVWILMPTALAIPSPRQLHQTNERLRQ